MAAAWNGEVFCLIDSTDVAVTSPDGITWGTHQLPTTSAWKVLGWNGAVFVALSTTAGVAATSPDGAVWTQKWLGILGSWSAIVAGASDNICAVASGGISALGSGSNPFAIPAFWTNFHGQFETL